MNGVHIKEAVCAGEIEEARRLFTEYNAHIAHITGADLCFQGFEKELAGLPGKYAPPDGGLYIAEDENGIALGCVAIYKMMDGICELKRLYVRPEARGLGAGRALFEHGLKMARDKGYEKLRLDTLRRMEEANALYEKYGFYEIEPYNQNPHEDIRYLEKVL